jgi:hypothetical protein
MIKVSRLFFVPSVSAVFVLVPFIGVFVWFFIIICWYDQNNLEINRFFKGQNYEQNELSENSLRDLK